MSWIGIALNRLRTSLWLIPAVMAVAGTALAVAMLFSGLAFRMGPDGSHWWVFSGDAGTARDLLSTLLSGMITMTSLVVSITMVVLSLSAGQLGPRLIWNFIDDRQIQAVIGLFVATIMYTLVVLRSINEELGPHHVPHAAITMASALVVVCLFALLFYLHKLARSIISDTMVDTVARHLSRAIATRSGDRPPAVGGPLPSGSLERRIALTDSGYVQYIDYPALCRLAVRHDALLTVRIRAGAFAIRGRCVIEALSPAPLPDDIEHAVRGAVVLGADRTPDQDLEYAIRQLVEIAVRALSPGINDPFTAITVIDRLAAAVEEIGRRPLPPQEYADEDGTVRVIADASTYEALVNTAFMQIRHSARDDAAVLLRLAARLRDLHEVAGSAARRDVLAKHLHMVERVAEGFAEPVDRRALEEAAAVPPGNSSVALPLR